MNLPLYIALGVLAWKLSTLGLLNVSAARMIFIGLAATYFVQAYQIYRVNKDVFTKSAPKIHRYNFKQIAILDLAYFVTFGSELAVVSMLPLFYHDTFGLSVVAAGMLASGFAFMNLVARPSGGWVSDKLGRKKTLLILLAGLSIGYVLMSRIDANWAIWAIWAAVIVTMTCSFFVQAGEGAVFAVVPLVKRRLTGQIAGMVGAYGNVGGVTFLTVLSFVSPQSFFLVIAGTAIVVLATVAFMEEPKGAMAEVLPDGTVQMIEVS